MNIVNIIQKSINDIINELYKGDACKPSVIISILREDDIDKIIITLTHMGRSFSDTLFPKKNIFDYDGLIDTIKFLYNSTM